jgi:asparagine synthase (glutamine-hydrolysing)
MCGIAGYLANSGQPVDRFLAGRMCARMAHRGPDGYGAFFGSGVALGHRRLSIIDVSGGAQPMGNEEGTLTVVFNGEIYNYEDLRRDLIEKGHRFRTCSDTEVLLHLYEEEGDRLPEFLNGMFTFAIWDAPNRTLFLARDRGREASLLHRIHFGAAFCFSSELKALTAVPEFADTVDPQASPIFLRSVIFRTQNDLSAGFKLPPGHCMTITPSGSRVRKYWSPTFAPIQMRTSAKRWRNRGPDQRFRPPTDDQRCSAGSVLSGGVDSGAVVAFMAASESVGAQDVHDRFHKLEIRRTPLRPHGGGPLCHGSP